MLPANGNADGPPGPDAFGAADLPARVLYRDALMLVIDKPPGLPVHAGPKRGPNLEALFDVLRFGLPHRPALAHRLDRETSGCLVLGRHRKALAQLGRLFAAGKVDKTYWALVHGAPPEAAGTVDLPLAKRSAERGWWMRVDPDHGQPAVTDYRVVASAGGMSWLELAPRTGRTHQLRVHMAALGCPLLGDRIYGNAPPPPAGPMLHLHARAVAVPLYPRRAPVGATADLPPHIAASFAALGFEVPPADATNAPAAR
jgi:tRNA pseudouridine32 synthase/23S rRNA pseudouridine746 synthase